MAGRNRSVSPHPGNAVAVQASAQSLSRRLKEHTRDCHRRAEQAGVIRETLQGTLSRAAYVLYLRNLHPVYQTLEQRLAPWRNDAVRHALADPALSRSPALENDLLQIAGEDWRTQLPIIAAGRAYASRVARASDPQLVAHAYVRYLGDLNGGRMMPRLLGRALNLPTRSMAFYDFPGLQSVTDCRSRFKTALDAAVAPQDAAAVLAEAQRAFALNITLAEDVQTATSTRLA
jgi:heme oxygenase